MLRFVAKAPGSTVCIQTPHLREHSSITSSLYGGKGVQLQLLKLMMLLGGRAVGVWNQNDDVILEFVSDKYDLM